MRRATTRSTRPAGSTTGPVKWTSVTYQMSRTNVRSNQPSSPSSWLSRTANSCGAVSAGYGHAITPDGVNVRLAHAALSLPVTISRTLRAPQARLAAPYRFRLRGAHRVQR